jgi:serine/threonine-protein kinase
VEDRRVLLAEDEEATAALLRMLLKSWGYSPIVVGDGRAALEVLETADPPPVALLDWMMPGLDGPSVCRAARVGKPREQGPFLFLLTARTQKEDIIAGLEAGADDYLTKPFDFGELKARLERARRVPPPDAAAAMARGTLLDGRWRLDSVIGKGGMGTVWRGTHASLGTPVAIKLIREEFVTHAETRARFEREARAAAAVRSRHVAEVLDYGVAPGGRPYLVMELLEGKTLTQTIAERGPLPAWEVTQLVRELAQGLERVHVAGIVHRDLKPDNVFLAKPIAGATLRSLPYVPKLVDFGVALDIARAAVTEAGMAVGTVAYMSPEQMCGGTVGPTSDVWALGAVAFEALTGTSPFDGGNVAATSVRVTVTPLPRASMLRPGLPPGIDAWFATACARDPAQRFQSAKELGDALYLASGGAAARADDAKSEALAPSPSSSQARREAPTDAAPVAVAPPAPARPAERREGKAKSPRREKKARKEKKARRATAGGRAGLGTAATTRMQTVPAPPIPAPPVLAPLALSSAPRQLAPATRDGTAVPRVAPRFLQVALLVLGALAGAVATALALAR